MPVIGVLFFDWRVFPLLALFWVENVIIGISNTLKMGSVRGTGMPGCFFAFHYGFFCLGHGVFIIILFGQFEVLRDSGTGIAVQVALFAVAILSLIIEHAYLLFRFVATRQNERVTRDRLVLEPFGRMIAMHTTLILGAWLAELYDQMQPMLLMLIGIKMFFDLIGWVIDLPPTGNYGRLRRACGDGAGAMIAAGMFAMFLIAWPASVISGSIAAFYVAPAMGIAAGFGVWLHRLLEASTAYRTAGRLLHVGVVGSLGIVVGVGVTYGLHNAGESISEAEQAAFKRKQQRQRDEQLKRNRPHEQARQRAVAHAKERLEANRKTNPSLEEVEVRASDVNLALRGEYSCSQTRSTNAHLAFDGDEATVWESSIDDRFVPAKLTVQWEDSVTINKVVLKQHHDRLMHFRIQVIDEKTGDWRQRFGLNGPRHYAPFWFPDRKRWELRRSLVELDGQLLSEQMDRVIGGAPNSDSLNTYTIYFPQPIDTRGLQLHIIEASQSPVEIAELMVY